MDQLNLRRREIFDGYREMRRNKNQFCVMCSETNPYFIVKVLDAVLKVRKVHISSNAYLGITIP